jgi:antitoxin MazE
MRVAKWGNSLAVRLPKQLVNALSLKADDKLEIVDATRRRLALAKDERRRQALERLASMRITLSPPTIASIARQPIRGERLTLSRCENGGSYARRQIGQ